MRNARVAAAQSAAIDAAAAYKRVKAITEAVEAHIAAHGRDGLVAFCAVHAGADMTVKTSILLAVNRLLGREARDDVRGVLPWL